MLDLDVRADIKEVTRYLSRVQRKQVPFATAIALQRTTFSTRKEVQAEINRSVDRPVKLTTKAVLVSGPTKLIKITSLSILKKDPHTIVFLRDEAFKGTPPSKYLDPLLTGKPRRHKGFERALIRAGIMRSNEYAVPGNDLRLNKYGNLPKGAITTMLSQLHSSSDSMQNATQSRRSKKGRRGKAYFMMRGFRGVFVRTGKRAFTVFIKFVTSKPSYRRKIRFNEVAYRTAAFRFPIEFRRAMTKALKSAR